MMVQQSAHRILMGLSEIAYSPHLSGPDFWLVARGVQIEDAVAVVVLHRASLQATGGDGF